MNYLYGDLFEGCDMIFLLLLEPVMHLQPMMFSVGLCTQPHECHYSLHRLYMPCLAYTACGRCLKNCVVSVVQLCSTYSGDHSVVLLC